MIMMMTDPDRVALSAFLPAFLFRFIHPIHPFMPMSTPTTFHRNVPLAICHTSYYPIRASSSVSHRSKFVLLVKHLGHARPSITSYAFSLSLRSTSQPVFFHFYIFCTQAANNHTKKLAIRVTSRRPPLILCKPARVHAHAFDYLCIYYPWRYLSRTKKKDLLGKRGTGAPKKRRS